MSLNINPTAPFFIVGSRARRALATSRRRWSAAIILLLTVCAVTSLSAQAWIQNYRAGVSAFNKKDFAEAERLLERALSQEPNQSRRKRFQGTTTDPYVPDYYLTLIYAESDRLAEARAAAKRIEGLFDPADQESRAMRDAIEAARRRAEPPPPVSPTGSTPVPVDPAGGKPPSAVPPPAAGRANPPDPPKPPPFEATLALAETALRDNDLGRLFDLLRQARNENGPAGRVDSLQQRGVTAAVNEGTRLLNENRFTTTDQLLGALAQRGVQDARLQQLRVQLQTARLERRVLKDLLEGRYEEVATGTETALRSGLRSARLLYYSACANAALDLLSGTEGGPRLSVARQRYTEAIKLGGPRAFAKEQAYISERIRAAAAGR